MKLLKCVLIVVNFAMDLGMKLLIIAWNVNQILLFIITQ